MIKLGTHLAEGTWLRDETAELVISSVVNPSIQYDGSEDGKTFQFGETKSLISFEFHDQSIAFGSTVELESTSKFIHSLIVKSDIAIISNCFTATQDFQSFEFEKSIKMESTFSLRSTFQFIQCTVKDRCEITFLRCHSYLSEIII
jgi:hypothetical protein